MGVDDAALIVVAAGSGERLGSEVRKALVPLGGRPLVMHSLARLGCAHGIGQVVLVGHPGDRDTLAALLADLPRPVALVDGGARRQDSVAAGLAAVEASTEWVLVHDAARPFASPELIGSLLQRATEVGAAVPAVPPADTVKEARPGADELCARTLPRDRLRMIQTPQAFRRSVLTALLEEARRNSRTVTDEAALFEAAGLDVAFVKGSPLNFKVTTRDDLELAEAVLARQAERND